MRVLAGTAFLLFLAATSGCFYSYGTVNYRDFERQGVSFGDAKKPGASSRAVTVRASARSFLLGDCDALATRALMKLAAKGQVAGGGGVTDVRFRTRWNWRNEAVCRRNWWYTLLVIPIFLPVPMSATVSGVATYQPVSEGLD